jgi:CDP-Glycerol:Poly(glycerophosphate) glycerophosphotransferase
MSHGSPAHVLLRSKNYITRSRKLAERKIKQAVKACIGAEYSWRLQRILFFLLYPAEYKLARKEFDVLFFCPSAQSWQNIKLVVEEFSRRSTWKVGVAFAGSRKELLPDSCNLAGISTIAHVTLGTLYLFDTRILYTTAQSLPPLTMPPKARVVHALFSMLSFDTVYPESLFDNHQYILCAGVHHLESFRKLALRRSALSGKRLLPAGYPKLDLMLASHLTKRGLTGRSARSTVVYAPTHTVPSNDHGETIISALLAQGHRVIFRPHPVSIYTERDFIGRICQLHAGNPNFSLDTSTDYTQSYSSADLMVTDLSGTGFTFSFSFSRPCIFFAPNAEAEGGQSGIQYDARHRIGTLVRNIDEMIEKTSELCNRDMTGEIERFRDETIFNVGKSAAYIVDCLEEILSGRERPEWVCL